MTGRRRQLRRWPRWPQPNNFLSSHRAENAEGGADWPRLFLCLVFFSEERRYGENLRYGEDPAYNCARQTPSSADVNRRAGLSSIPPVHPFQGKKDGGIEDNAAQFEGRRSDVSFIPTQLQTKGAPPLKRYFMRYVRSVILSPDIPLTLARGSTGGGGPALKRYFTK
jgi:hypothetical protein